MIHQSQLTAPRARRRPSARNQQIYEEVRVQGGRQTAVAARYGLSQKRVSAICQQIDAWHEAVNRSPDFDELVERQKRTIQLQCRKRAEQMLMAALAQASARQQVVTEVTRTEKGQTTVQRTVRDVPADPAYLQVAEKLLREMQRIDLAVGVDVESSWRIEEAEELIARLTGRKEAGASGRGGEAEMEVAGGANTAEPEGGCKYSRCSNDKRLSAPQRPVAAGGPITAEGGKPTTYARSAEERRADINRQKRRKFFER